VAVERLRKRYAAKLQQLQDRQRRAEQKVEIQEAQLAEQKQSALISAGATLLGALLGRRALSAGTAGRLGTTLHRGSRISREKQDVERAIGDEGAVRERIAELEAELASEVAALDATPNAGSFALEARPLRPRKGDLAIDPVTLVWTPWALGPDGVATPLFDR
jgi:hypothetical protein